MQDPKVLLLDEPTAGLSPLYVDMFFDKIREIHQTRSVAIVLAEQNATKALHVADRVMVLSLGEAYAVMDATDLTTQQRRRVTASDDPTQSGQDTGGERNEGQ
jgi:branched-chain amino acid transport system ATP-binding protein